jgi:hypothetical protein
LVGGHLPLAVVVGVYLQRADAEAVLADHPDSRTGCVAKLAEAV